MSERKEKKRKEKKRKEKKRKEKKEKKRKEKKILCCRCQHPQKTFVSLFKSVITVPSRLHHMTVPHDSRKSATDEITVTLMQSIPARLL